jgi:type III secretion protein C
MKLAPCLRALIASACVLLSPLVHAGPVPWPDAPYSYFANQAKLETVLADFASGFSLSLAMQPDVTGIVNGRFQTSSPTEFLSKLAGVYGFVWYTQAGTLFVSRANDIVTRGVAAPGGSAASMRKALSDLGVLEPRFGWGELGDQGVAMVSGPPSYVHLIESTIRNLPPRAQQLMVFRLQHASADDRTVRYRDKEVITPGLASILRTMVAAGGGGSAVTSGGQAGLGGGVGAPLRASTSTADAAGAASGTPPAPSSSAPSGAVSQQHGASQGQQGPKPMVQAEPRLNAVIIQDYPERMPLYQQLIAQLDVATPMVEIEAMIIDISSQRASELGVDWSGRIGKLNVDLNSKTGALLAFSSAATAAGSVLMSQLRALENKGDADIQSRPSVLTSDNIAAILDLSETFYIQSQGERVASVTPVTAGTTLNVSPHVVRQGDQLLVQMKIDIEDGQINSDTVVGALPTVSKSTVSTEATVRSGESLLIAGYASRRTIKNRSQIPFLGELPVAGALFGSTDHNVQKRDRMFLIRPKVVELPVVVMPGDTPQGK